jgi:hypothetical protein
MVGGPGVAKLAKDFKVEVQKEHFPHYFHPLHHGKTLEYKGPLPAYEFFEPRSSTRASYLGRPPGPPTRGRRSLRGGA